MRTPGTFIGEFKTQTFHTLNNFEVFFVDNGRVKIRVKHLVKDIRNSLHMPGLSYSLFGIDQSDTRSVTDRAQLAFLKNCPRHVRISINWCCRYQCH